MTGHDDFRATVKHGYDGLAADYDAQRDDENPPDLLVDALADATVGDDGDQPRLLDVGCGGGRGVLAPFGDGFRATGVDFSREQLRLVGERAPGARRAQGDMTDLPFADDAFDALTALHSVIHVPSEQHPGVYEEFRRVLGGGGVAVVTAGQGAWSGTNDDWLDTGERMQWSFPDPEATERSFVDAGFDVRRFEDVSGGLSGGAWRFYRVE